MEYGITIHAPCACNENPDFIPIQEGCIRSDESGRSLKSSDALLTSRILTTPQQVIALCEHDMSLQVSIVAAL